MRVDGAVPGNAMPGSLSAEQECDLVGCWSRVGGQQVWEEFARLADSNHNSGGFCFGLLMCLTVQ